MFPCFCRTLLRPSVFCLSILYLPTILLGQVAASDGTNFRRVSDWAPGTEDALPQELCPGPIPGSLIEHDTYWTADGDGGLNVVVHDGTQSTLRRIDGLGSVETTAEFAPAGGLCYERVHRASAQAGLLHFFLNDGISAGGSYDWEVWASDGTTQGTRSVLDLASTASIEFGPAFRDEQLFIVGDGSTHLLWTSDGTPEGTQPFLDPAPDSQFLYPYQPSGDLVFFAARSAERTFWASDGTQEGTRLLLTLSAQQTISDLIAYDGGVYFFIARIQEPRTATLWFSDGTVEGTSPIVRVHDHHATPRKMLIVDDLLFFALDDPQPTGDEDLWRSDGTAEGTFPLMKIAYGLQGSMISLRDRVLFQARNSIDGLGAELYVSDGTVEGTVLLRDVFPGPQGSQPRDFLLDGNQILFTADDGAHGREIWRTDGTPEGTVLYIDTVTGPDSLEPKSLRRGAGQTFFVGENDAEGREIYKIDRLSSVDVPALDVFGSTLFTLFIAFAGLRAFRSSGVLPSTSEEI